MPPQSILISYGHAIGSLTYMTNECDDFLVKMANFASAKQSLSNDISDLTKEIEMLNKKQIKTEKDLECLEQYGRREDLEIHDIPFTQNEKTNEIVKKVANVLKVTIEDKDISTSHRIFNDSKYPADWVSSKLVTAAGTHLL